MSDEKQPTYQEELRAACAEWWQKYEEATGSDKLIRFDWPAILYDFVKAIALDSFKNGVTVGKRKARHDEQPADGDGH